MRRYGSLATKNYQDMQVAYIHAMLDALMHAWVYTVYHTDVKPIVYNESAHEPDRAANSSSPYIVPLRWKMDLNYSKNLHDCYK